MNGHASRTTSRAIVIAFVALVVAITAVAIAIRWTNEGRIRSAQVAAMPTLSANVKVLCESNGASHAVARGGACASGASLVLSATEPGDGTKALIVALLGPAPRVEPLAFGPPLKLPLAGDGPRELALVLSSTNADPAPLRRQLEADAKRDVRLQVEDAEAFVSQIIAGGAFARVERYPFRAGP